MINRHIDDPVGACSVHLVGGIWGHICVGLFAQDTTPLQWTNGRAGLFMGMRKLIISKFSVKIF